MRLEAGTFTKVIYGIALTLLGLTVVLRVPYAMILLKQMATNPNVVNPLTATIIVAMAVITGVVAVSRVVGLLRGSVTLSSYSGSGLLTLMRYSGMTFMTIGVLITAGVFAGLLLTRIGAVALIGAQFQMLLPVGLGLYELSRLMGFERNEEEEA